MTLLRAYPTISDLIHDVSGIYVPLPIHSFGFFVALAFVAAAWLLSLELRRKHRLGQIGAIKRTILLGEPPSPRELVVNGIVWFLVGFKIIGGVLNYGACTANPQAYIFSLEGSLLGGLATGALAVWLRYRTKMKARLPQPKSQTVEVPPQQLVGDLVVIAAVFGLIGAKLFHFLEQPSDLRYFLENPGEGLFSGLTIYGGLIIGTVAVVVWATKRRISVWHLGDAFGPALMLAYAVGRIGCQISGDGDWGIPNPHDMPGWMSFLPEWLWASDYSHNILNEGVPIPGCGENHCHRLDPKVYPTPLYETLVCTTLFGVMWAARKRIRIPGLMLALYMILNGLERFFIEKIRVNVQYRWAGIEFTQAELISLLLIAGGLALGYWAFRKARNVKKP